MIAKKTICTIIGRDNKEEKYAEKIVEMTANDIVDFVYTLSDFIDTMLGGVDPYTINEMSLGDWNTHWLCDTTFCYIFIREANTSNSYYYAFCGSQLLVDYYYTQTISVEMEDGSSEEYIYSIEMQGEVITNSNYNNIKMAADAYEEYGQNGFAYGLTVPRITLFKGTDKAIEVPFECAAYKSPYGYTSLQEGT